MDKIYKQTYGNVSVVDPNKLSDGNGGYVDRYINQEDLVMYAKLVVYSNSKTTIMTSDTSNNSDTTEFTYVNFLDPANKGTLTTGWTDMFEPNRPYESETFGISSIKIEYNASYIPTVSIEFLDIRGKTLFERGDDPKNPYNLFFQFPYPQFSLTIKGYYGRAVTIPLILEKANTNFDAQSGDYRTTTTFRSFTFAMLNDVPLRYLAQAPYMYEIPLPGSKKGYEGTKILVDILKRYYTEQGIDLCEFGKNGVKDDPSYYHNKYPITIPDFLFRIKYLESDIVQTPQIANKIKRYDEILKTKDALSKFELELRRSLIQVGFVENGNRFVYSDNSADFTAIINNVYDLIDANIFSSLSENIDGYNYNSSVIDFVFRKNFPTIKKLSNGAGYIIDISTLLKSFNEQFIKKINETTTASLDDLNKLLKRSATERLGFEPTLKNVVTLFLANFETFMSLLYKKSRLAYKDAVKRGDNAPITGSPYIEQTDSYYANKEKIVYPWPDFFLKDPKTNEYTKSFPGNNFYYRNREEVKFINELMESVVRMQEDLGNRRTFDEDTRVQINYTPISPEDVPAMFLSKNGNLTVDFYNSNSGVDINYFYNPEGDKNIGQFKFPKKNDNEDLTKPLSSAVSLITKALENAIYLGFSSMDPMALNETTIKIDGFASEIGEAHANNLFNNLGSKSTISAYLAKLLTKGTGQLDTKFFQELFVNQRAEGEEKGEDVEKIKDVIQNRYRNVFLNNIAFTPFHKFKKLPTITETGLKLDDKMIYGRAGNIAQIYRGYNSNINTFQKIDLNEEYQANRKNKNVGGLEAGIDSLKLVGDKTIDNYNVFRNDLITTDNSVYLNKNNTTNFNTDNSLKIRKLYVGSVDAGTSSERDVYMSSKYFMQEIPDTEDYKLAFRRYQNTFSRDGLDVINIGYDEYDDAVDKTGDLDTTVENTPITSETIEVRAQSLLDTIAALESGFNISNKTHRANDNNFGYSVYISGNIPNTAASLISVKNGHNFMTGWNNTDNNYHPNVVISGSTAAGRYQFLYSTWTNEIGTKVFNKSQLPMTKANQDVGCLYLAFKIPTQNTKGGKKYNTKDKIGLLKNNNMKELIGSLASQWAAIPGYYNQATNSLDDIYKIYQKILAYNMGSGNTLSKEALNYFNTLTT